MYRNLFVIWMFLLLAFSCTEKAGRDSAIISGTFKGENGKTLRLEELKTRNSIVVDSITVQPDGTFQFSIQPGEKGFYLLRNGENTPITLVLDKQDTLILTIDTGNANRSYHVEGNDDSKLLRAYYNQTGMAKAGIDSLREVLLKTRELENFADKKPQIDSILEGILHRHKIFTENLISNNPGSIATILLLNQTFAGRPVFNTSDDYELYILTDSALMQNLPGNSHVKAHHERVEDLRAQKYASEEAEKQVGPGKTVPDIKLPDTENRDIRLSSLRGKLVILFFWASWSPECRADMQQIKSLYKSEGHATFEVYAVSFDHQGKLWKAAVETENPGWINVLADGGPDGPVGKLFNLQGRLPFYYIIDRNGIIVSKTEDFSIMADSLKKHLQQSG